MIYANEFNGCSNLKNVKIGEGVEAIGEMAFHGCNGLDYFAFGSKLKSIGKGAFCDWEKVKMIVSKSATPPVCEPEAIEDVNFIHVTLKVPTGSESLYKNADQWNQFENLQSGAENVEDPGSGYDPGEEPGGDIDPEPGDDPEPELVQCATPVITFNQGKFHFSCETAGAKIYFTTSKISATEGEGSESSQDMKLTATAYATAKGFLKSETATLTIDLSETGTGLVGDVDGDGVITIADVTKLVDILKTSK